MRSPLQARGKVGRRRPQRTQRGKQRGGCSQRPGDDDGDFVDNDDDDDFDGDDDDDFDVDDDDDDDDDIDNDGDDEVKYIREAEAEKKADAGNAGKSITHFHPFYLQKIMLGDMSLSYHEPITLNFNKNVSNN